MDGLDEPPYRLIEPWKLYLAWESCQFYFLIQFLQFNS